MADASTTWRPGTPPERDAVELQQPSDVYNARRDQTLRQVQEDYERYQKDRTFAYPNWLYGPTKGTLFKIECEDNPTFGETSHLEFDSGRTAFIGIDWQVDFCGEGGYVDVMGYELQNTAGPISATKNVLEAVRRTDMKVVHTREGHRPDLSDAPYNKLLRSKIIGNGVGIGETPKNGMGPLLTQGSRNWSIIQELAPTDGEMVVDKAGKGVSGVSNFFLVLQNLGVTHLVITGITTDVCVSSIMTQANDMGFWCVLLKDCTGATDVGNYDASIKSCKMQGGVFGWVSDSKSFLHGMKDAGLA